MPDYTITHYGNRFFALYSKRQCACRTTDDVDRIDDGDDLLAVTVYKKGAQRLLNELVARDNEIAQRSLSSARSSAPPHAQAPQPNIQLPAP
jgi:hypothetical protein